MPTLLHYRSWQGTFRSPWWSVWPIARVSLGMLFRRILFWALYAFGLLLFLMFFFGTYLLALIQSQVAASAQQIGQIGLNPGRMVAQLQSALSILNGGRDTFQYFFAYQGGMVIIMLSLVGSILVGNDFTFRSIGFYLAKPINRWHYILGKCSAVFVVVHMMTTLPAVLLFAQRSFDDWDYFANVNHFIEIGGKGPAGIVLLGSILAYGTLLATVLSIMLVATASWMRRTMPLIMVWMSLFFFLRLLANMLVDNLKYDVHWRLIDQWNNLTLLGQACLGYGNEEVSNQPQPEFWAAGLMLAGVCAVCLIYLNHRTRSVEIVR